MAMRGPLSPAGSTQPSQPGQARAPPLVAWPRGGGGVGQEKRCGPLPCGSPCCHAAGAAERRETLLPCCPAALPPPLQPCHPHSDCVAASSAQRMTIHKTKQNKKKPNLETWPFTSFRDMMSMKRDPYPNLLWSNFFTQVYKCIRVLSTVKSCMCSHYCCCCCCCRHNQNPL